MPSSALLTATGLTRAFQGLLAVDHVDFAVQAGTVHGIIGPNGAGKTTLFNLISGLLEPTEGTVSLDGRPIERLSAHRRAALGVARTFQNIRIFSEMTVLENVMTGRHCRLGAGLGGILLRLPGFRREEVAAKEAARAHLAFVGLAEMADRRAGDLPYGDQRRLEIARALAAEPRLLLLDEPAAGMNPAETRALMPLLRQLRERGITVLLVEHDMHFVMNLCDRITVINFGRRIAEGTPREMRENPAVIEAYLGTKATSRRGRGAVPVTTTTDALG
ncbi:MAG TPA: ABC transporter ATP-binding protein [Stellaceae bacterium]|nr:ABC transporter ATP-binding protein [Stellaceae bacterium]